MLWKYAEVISEVHKSTSLTQAFWYIEVTYYSVEIIGGLPWANSGNCLGIVCTGCLKLTVLEKKIYMSNISQISITTCKINRAA